MGTAVSTSFAPAPKAPPWAHIAGAAVVTADMATDALLQLELLHTQFVHTQRRAAERRGWIART